MPFMTANSYFGLAPETTYGTAASITTYTPIGNPKVTPDLKWLDDSDFRGSPVMHYDQVPGIRSDKFDGKTYMYSDVYPNLIRAVLGGTDSVASSVHTIGVLNSASTGSQAPSYTIINDSVDNTYQITAARLIDMSIAFNADAAVETTFSFVGNPSASVTSPTNPAESTQHFVPAWSCSASIGPIGSAASVAVVEEATIDIKRNTTPIHTLGQQGPYNNFQGPIEVTGKFKFVADNGAASVGANTTNYWNNALTRDQQQVIVRFTDPATGYYIQFQMSAVQFEKPMIDQSKAYISIDTEFTAVANTNDATSGGYSPIKAVISNNVATAY